ncbi:MAG: hypothetical protein LBM25_02115 [Bacteroidales bacterium]|nr:hypothetical protein [Bacteroidales bacterium]
MHPTKRTRCYTKKQRIDVSNTKPKRIYYRICIIKYILITISPDNTFTEKLKTLLSKYPTIDPFAMGFPYSWQNEPLWKYKHISKNE